MRLNPAALALIRQRCPLMQVKNGNFCAQNQLKLPSLLAMQSSSADFHTSFARYDDNEKAEKKPKPSGRKPIVGLRAGHDMDPEFWTMNRDIAQPGIPEWSYREYAPDWPLIDHQLTYFFSAFIWFWVLYHMYYYYGHIIGEVYVPYVEEFTDEELGIPPDDAPDPEYWGPQQPHVPAE